MFCTSLRRRPSFSAAIPSLTAPPLAARESQLLTHDVEIKLPSNVNPRSSTNQSPCIIHFLLLSPSCVEEKRISETLQRIHHFTALTGGQDLAIIFLINPPPAISFTSAKNVVESATKPRMGDVDGIYAYSKLQARMMGLSELPHIPTLPLYRTEGLQALLSRYMESLMQTPVRTAPSMKPLDLLRQCTLQPPMPQHTAFILSDVFANITDLAVTCADATPGLDPGRDPTATSSSPQQDGMYAVDPRVRSFNASTKLKQLRDLLGEQEYLNVVKFWEEERIAD